MLPACPDAPPPTPWPEGVDYWLTRAAVTLAGLINTGGEAGFCLSGGIDAWDARGRYRGFSPNVVARMREAGLLPAKLAGQA